MTTLVTVPDQLTAFAPGLQGYADVLYGFPSDVPPAKVAYQRREESEMGEAVQNGLCDRHRFLGLTYRSKARREDVYP